MAESPVTDYIARYAGPTRQALENLVSLVREFEPSVTEALSYGMPTLCYLGQPLAGFKVWKAHIGFYPHSGRIIHQVSEELRGLKKSSGAVQFTADHPIPPASLMQMLELRRLEIEQRRKI